MKYLLRMFALSPLRPPVFTAMLRMLRWLKMLPATKTASNTPPRRVLVVNLTEFIGDTVMMLPLLDRLNSALPAATVDVVTSSKMAYLLRQIQYPGHIQGFESSSIKIPVLSTYCRLIGMVRFVQSVLQDRSYDLCLLPRWGTDSNMSLFLASMSGASWLVGHDPNDELGVRNPFPGAEGLLDCTSRGGAGLPEAVRELRLLESCGIVGPLNLSAEERKPVDSLLQIADRTSLRELKQKLGLTDSPLVVIAPGASHAARRWPPERFAEIAVSLGFKLGGQVLVIGGADDLAIGQLIERQVGGTARNLIGRTSLLDNMALLRSAAILITNDSGPAHIGGGLGTPTVVLSACPLTSTSEHVNSPLRVRPVGPRILVLQPPKAAYGCVERCRASAAHCILGLTVEFVLHQAEQSLTGNS